MGRMERLRAEGDRLWAEYEENLLVAKQEERKVEKEHLKAEEERRMQAEQQCQEEERLQAEQEQLQIEEEQRQEKEEWELAERLAAAELLIEFEQILKQSRNTNEASSSGGCMPTNREFC